MKTKILQNFFLKEDGTFDLENALLFSGRIAGVCYDKEGFEHLEKEDISNTQKRINNTLENDHHSVYDHIMINFNIVGIPKILAMVLNNEHQYTTSEKSARYTDVTYKNGSILTEREVTLYNKWNERFKELIKENKTNDDLIKILQKSGILIISLVGIGTGFYLAPWTTFAITSAATLTEPTICKVYKSVVDPTMDIVGLIPKFLVKVAICIKNWWYKNKPINEPSKGL